MLLHQIAKQFGCINGQIEITSLTLDSRVCAPGSLYFAITGTRVNGHDYVRAAWEKGAAAAVVEHSVDCPIPQVVVPDSRSAMSVMAAEFYGNPSRNLHMLGVTGTNGKTSVSYMVRAIARQAGISCGVMGTSGICLDDRKLEIEIATSTTPDPIELQLALAEMVKDGAQWCAMEVTAHALDLRKVDGIHFTSAGFTNLTQDHLDYFETMDHYFAAKQKLFTPALSEVAVLNVDDSYGLLLAKDCGIRSLTYSTKREADLMARNIHILPAATEFDLQYEGRLYPVRTHTTGLFNVSNALCAIGCTLSAGVDIVAAVEGISAFTSVPGRFEAVPVNQGEVSVIVDYAHTPDGLENVLKAINAFKKGRLICVFGCGGNRDAKKRSIMGELAGNLSDYCILTSDNPRFEEPESILDAIEEGIRNTTCPYTRIADRRQAIAMALQYAEPGDVIAICGKGDEDYQDVMGEKHHFSDREVVEALGQQSTE